jgi:starch-binding outer membrane protein, SusD/RagB family
MHNIPTMRRTLLMPAVLACLAGVACSDILNVELPGRIPSELLGDPITAPTLAASVVADFECAFSNYVTSAVQLSDQFLGASGNLNAKNWGTRKINDDDTANEQTSCAGSYGAYTPLQTARFQADDILARLQTWTDAEAKVALAPLRARVAAFGAFSYALLGEGFCAMRFNQEKVIHTPAEVLATAEAKFDAALALVTAMPAGTAKTELQNLVYVGRARVRLDRGNLAGAASDAALVTPGFEFFVTRSVDAATRWNDAWYALAELGHGSVDPAYRNLTVNGVKDPRVQVSFGPDVGLPELAFDGVTDLYVVTNKTSLVLTTCAWRATSRRS